MNKFLLFRPVLDLEGTLADETAKLQAEKGCDDTLLRCIWQREITLRIARTEIEPRHTLGQHRWIIERSLALLSEYRRLTQRYESTANHYAAFPAFAAAPNLLRKHLA
ncbi:Transposase DDE domain-containing protein [Actinopolyspora mzabensis]|uniref:Transposase DDE domain-containing protein n=1 Tax=Actinopolyspora mzabensis TaxID=995066 RepID=A0A1G8XEA6_ACTMZ|nr:Transposase DDE domain-containing protein [Actinopolyspora mzabensis]